MELLAAVVALLAVLPRSSNACTCVAMDDDQKLCQSQQVLLAKIDTEQCVYRSEGTPPPNDENCNLGTKVYKGTVWDIKSYNPAKGNTLSPISGATIETAGNSGLCGINLNSGGAYYILSGQGSTPDAISVDLCESYNVMISPSVEFSTIQAKLSKEVYNTMQKLGSCGPAVISRRRIRL